MELKRDLPNSTFLGSGSRFGPRSSTGATRDLLPSPSPRPTHLQLELQIRGVARLLTLDGHLPSELHGESADQDALAVGVRHGDPVLLAAGQQGQGRRARQNRRGRVTWRWGGGR